MKGILTFDLVEEQMDFLTAVHASDFVAVIDDLYNWLRDNYKYDKGDISVDAAEKVKDYLYNLLREQGILNLIN